jgi:hypothetical protein
MARFVALLIAVNVAERRVAMPTALTVLQGLGFDDVGSYANSGNLMSGHLGGRRITRPQSAQPCWRTRSGAQFGANDLQ